MKIAISSERCLNKKFVKANCQVCTAVCPAKAINEKHEPNDNCINCGLCLAKCPTEAIAGISYSEESMVQLMNGDQPIRLICKKAHPESPWPCLGFMDPILLLALVLSNKDSNREVLIYREDCEACNASIAKHIAWTIEEANRFLGSGKRQIIISAKKFSRVFPPDSSRRQFLGRLWGASLATVRNIAFPGSENVKAIRRRELFLSYCGKKQLPSTVYDQATFKALDINESCNACGICAKICLQGAITAVTQETSLEIRHDPVLCNNCGICAAQCPQGAISIIPAKSLAEAVVKRVSIPICRDCGKRYRPLGNTEICFDCMQKTKIFPF